MNCILLSQFGLGATSCIAGSCVIFCLVLVIRRALLDFFLSLGCMSFEQRTKNSSITGFPGGICIFLPQLLLTAISDETDDFTIKLRMPHSPTCFMSAFFLISGARTGHETRLLASLANRCAKKTSWWGRTDDRCQCVGCNLAGLCCTSFFSECKD